jgi:hypothetical protein
MLRSSITSAGVLLLGASAFAQSNAHSMLRPVTSTVKDGGVYHVGTGQWSRHSDTANGITHDIIYSNTCPTGYYAGMYTKEYVADEGRVPSANGPTNCSTVDDLSLNKGCACSYTVCGFQIAYCSGLPGPGIGGGPGPVSLNIGFQGAYTACALPATLPGGPGTFTITGLPAAGTGGPGAQGCWIITMDLDATSQSFSLPADGASCTWLPTGDTGANHLFGWTFQVLTPGVSGANGATNYVGPLIAGYGGPFAPVPTCSQVDNTRWDTLTCSGQLGGPAKWPNNTTEDGWGMDTQDRFRDDTTNSTGGPLAPPSGPGCYFFNGVIDGSFHLKLFANTGCPPPSPGVDVCRPTVAGGTPVEDGWTCPCAPGNQPTLAGAGCNALNSVPNGGGPTGGSIITSTGVASLSADTVHITAAHLPLFSGESCFLLSGTTTINPLAFGQGLRCAAGTIKRLQLHSPVPTGTSTWPQAGDFNPTLHGRAAQLGDIIAIGSPRTYFVQYRATNIVTGCVFPNNFGSSQSQVITWGM